AAARRADRRRRAQTPPPPLPRGRTTGAGARPRMVRRALRRARLPRRRPRRRAPLRRLAAGASSVSAQPTYGVDVLAFGPHPDDVEIFGGGTTSHLCALGHATAVIDLTRGEAASRGTPETRAREAEAAARVLGLRFRENLGLPDTGLDPTDRHQLEAAVDAIRRHRPEILLLPWFEERHPDHVAAAQLLTKAAYFAGVRNFAPGRERFVPRQVLYYQLRYRMPPTFVIDTTAAAARKREAIACYRSQVERRPGDVPTL